MWIVSSNEVFWGLLECISLMLKTLAWCYLSHLWYGCEQGFYWHTKSPFFSALNITWHHVILSYFEKWLVQHNIKTFHALTTTPSPPNKRCISGKIFHLEELKFLICWHFLDQNQTAFGEVKSKNKRGMLANQTFLTPVTRSSPSFLPGLIWKVNYFVWHITRTLLSVP